ncbi:MAG: PIN domain-containing protein [Deferrisomatales bacterium]|nr:PIN domain-containing protein [Deferrisomatales bacterium]
MRAIIDLNVVLDVVQRRVPRYAASALVLSRVAERHLEGALPSHAVPILHYIVGRFASREKAGELIDWLLRDFDIVETGKTDLVLARNLGFADFEDAIVAACAVRGGCDLIVTRNIADFAKSPVPAWTPEELLARDAAPGE